MPDLVAGTSQVATVITEAQFETFPTPTIIRVRGRLMVTQDTGMTAGGIAICHLGLIVVTNTALAAGAASIPDPAVDVGSDWLWIDSGAVGEETSSSVIGRPISVDRLLVDSKSMRKVGLNQALVIVGSVVNGSPVGAGAANVNGALRFLLKAP